MLFSFRKIRALIFLMLAATNTAVWGLDINAHQDVRILIGEMVREHGFKAGDLNRIFAHAQLRPEIVEAMQRPYEAKPWYQYRRLFITDQNIANGVEFWRANKAVLQRAEDVFGVPASIVVAIIGIETRYGKVLGKHPVIDSLTTLVLQYPRRSRYFRKELKHYLLLTRDEGLDPVTTRGSYAGAMGIPQFLASSYRSYAVDFNNDGRRDLLAQPEDAIGSVANYLAKHRWARAQPVVTTVHLGEGVSLDGLVNRKLKPKHTVQQLDQAGVRLIGEFDKELRASLVELEQANDGKEHRATFPNFYVITRYNQSIHYAMAMYELSVALEKAALLTMR